MKSFLKKSMFIIGCMLLIIPACEDINLENDEAGIVQGFWQLNESQGNNTFLLISDTEVIFYYYDARENCITIDAYEVVRIDGTGFYILTQDGLEENRVLAISKNGESIHVRDIEETQSELEIYGASTVDINTLAPICVDPTDVFGNWEVEDEEGHITYLSVTTDTITVISYVEDGSCYFTSVLEVFEINGNLFTISDNAPTSTTGRQEVKLIRTTEGLEIERREEGETVQELYIESNADFSVFTPVCTFNPLQDLEGTWQYNASQEEGDVELYLSIDAEFFTFHFRVGDPINDPDNVCFDVQSFEIIAIGDGTVTLRDINEPLEEEVLMIDFKEEENLLYVDDSLDILSFFLTDIDEGYINNQCPETTQLINKFF